MEQNMENSAKKNTGATKDKRRKMVDAAMRRHGHSTFALIETLHSVQEVYGYLDEDNLRYVARELRVPLSKVYGVATFYHFFTLKPQGDHTCVVCTGTACYIKGVPAIFSEIKKNYLVNPGETTDDGKVSVLTARCIGSCGLAPAVVFDGEIAGKVTPEDVVERIGRLMKNDA
jgi:bidirectional [NiFe] hydrogenase diaphorase subunit